MDREMEQSDEVAKKELHHAKLDEIYQLHKTLRSRIELEASHLQSLVNQSLQARAIGVALPESKTDDLQQVVNLEMI
ncbi:hypothetical protein [Roseiconus lacunae]|nr:hypothetical protein [Roseiconus lacunae]